MATILNNAAYMALPMNIKRGNPIPLDTTAVWYNKTELETYAKTGATAYVGQVLTLVTGGKCEAYMISNEAGTLVKLAQTTATGDLATDVTTLKGQVDSLIKQVGAAAEGEKAATGLYELIADVETVAKARLESVEAGDNSVTIAGSPTKPSVAVKVSKAEGNALVLDTDGLKVTIPEVKVPAYSLVKDETAAAGDVATYHLTKDGKNEGVAINIPKDLVVASGSVVKLEDGALPDGVTVAGTYIKLILANSTKPIYINVGDLIEYVTGGSGENDAIQINVSSDTHKVSATVKNGSLTTDMLAADVVTSLGKADSAVQSVAAGDTNGTIKVDGNEVAVTGLQDAAYATVKSINDTAQGYVNTAKTVLEGTATDTDESVTIAGAKKYADKVAGAAATNADTALTNKIGELKNSDKAVEKQFVTAVIEADGIVTVERKALTAADIPELGVSKITGLQGLLDGKQNTLTFDGEYKTGVNNAATVSTVNTAKADLIGDTSKEATSTENNTIADVRRYVDAKTKGIASDAKLAELSDKVTKNTGDIKIIKDSLAEGGSVSNAIADAKKAGTDAQTAVDTLAGKVGAVTAGKTVVEMIADAQTAATYDDAAVKANIKKNTDAIAAINNADTGILKQAKTYADGKDAAIAAINTKLGAIPADKTVAEAIEDAKTAATYNDTAIKNRVKTIEDDYLKKADKTALETAINTEKGRLDTFLNAAEVGDAAVDTLKEIQEYISTHGAAADKMVKDIAANKTAIETEASTARAAEKKNTDAITKLNGAADIEGSVSNKVMSAIDDLQLDATYVKKEVDRRLMSNNEGSKLEGIAEGAQVNVIESIKVNNVAQTIDGKAVNIAVPVADDASIAITENKIGIKAVDVQKLFIADGDVLIIDGGKA